MPDNTIETIVELKVIEPLPVYVCQYCGERSHVQNVYFSRPQLGVLMLCEKHREKLQQGQVTQWDQRR